MIRSAEGLERLLARRCAAAAPRRRERAHPAREPRRALPLRLPDRGRGVRSARRPDARRGAAARTMELTPEALEPVVRAALAEDVGSGDRTTDGLVPADARCTAELLLEGAGRRLRRRSRARGLPGARSSGARRSPARGGLAHHRCSRTRRHDRGPGTRDPHGRAHRAQHLRPALRNRDAHRPVRRSRRWHGHGDPRHAQDDARPARARALRGSLRRRNEPPLRAARRDPRQGEPSPHRRRDRARGRRAAATAGRSRSRRRRSTTSPKRSRQESNGFCSTT